MTQEEIMKRIVLMAEALDFDLNSNLQTIARIKARQSDWRTCCCDPKNEHRYCGSSLCEKETKKDGKCHCCLMKLKKTSYKASNELLDKLEVNELPLIFAYKNGKVVSKFDEKESSLDEWVKYIQW